jgi:hypothetical protein
LVVRTQIPGIRPVPLASLGAALAFASLLQACAAGGGLKLPTALEGRDTRDKLRENAGATDGCAFAGIWSYSYYYSAAAGGGRFVFEVLGTKLRGASIEHGGLVTRYADEFVIVDADIAPGGRSAAGRWRLRSELGSLPVSFDLAADGLTYEMTGGPSTGDIIDGIKGRTLPCNQPVKFVQDAFDSVFAAKPIPQEYLRQ